MENYRISIFGELTDLDAFDEILFELCDETDPDERALAFERMLKEGEGEVSFQKMSKFGSPFDRVKPHLQAANLGWKELTSKEDGNFYQAVIVSPGDYEEITIDLVHGEPVIELSVLQRARDEGQEALERLIATVEKTSRYGEDLTLTLGDNLVARYIDTIETDAPSP